MVHFAFAARLFTAASLLALLFTAEHNSSFPLTFVISLYSALQFSAFLHVIVDHFFMDESHRDEGGVSRIPVWVGDPSRWEVFKKDVEWWLAGEDLNKTLSYNLAARFFQRQKSTARARARELTLEISRLCLRSRMLKAMWLLLQILALALISS